MLSGLVQALVDAVAPVLNALIAALAVAAAAVLGLLPDMPALPDLPAPMVQAEAWVAWAFPVETVWNILVFSAGVWLLWQAVAIALRWAKALSD
jgi:hypothetical protein